VANLEKLTSAKCRTLASILKKSLADLGITVPPGSDLAKMQDAIDWLASFPLTGDLLAKAQRKDGRRAVDAALWYEQAQRITIAIGWACRIEGGAALVSRLRKRFNRLQSQDAPALDFFFELDIAHRIAQRGLSVSLQEPDILVQVDDLQIAVACKRPRSLKGMAARIKEGADQVVKRGLRGFVVVSLEPCFHRPHGPQRGVVGYDVKDLDELIKVAEPMVENAIRVTSPILAGIFEKGLWGVLFCGLITAYARRPPALIYHWARRSISNPRFPGAAERLEADIFRKMNPAS
jgi:hypothetical protein